MELSSLSVKQIKEYLQDIQVQDYKPLVQKLSTDSRKAVQNISNRLERKYDKYLQELNRIKEVKAIEESFYNKGYTVIAGIDEVGRGPLAGPVVSAAVIMPRESKIMYINDSKKISPKRREELYEIICSEALDIGIGIVEQDVIDMINIYNATKLSMKKAIGSLKETPDMLLIDAMNLDNINIKQHSIIKGDEKCYSISAASIIAKVTRDRIMDKYHLEYPQYNFISNKGYGTKEHIQAIKKFYPCILHRKSFLKNILYEGD